MTWSGFLDRGGVPKAPKNPGSFQRQGKATDRRTTRGNQRWLTWVQKYLKSFWLDCPARVLDETTAGPPCIVFEAPWALPPLPLFLKSIV